MTGELGLACLMVNASGAGFSFDGHQPSYRMFTVPASNWSVPFTVVMRTISRTPPRVTSPPIMLVAVSVAPKLTRPLQTHIFPDKFVKTMFPDKA